MSLLLARVAENLYWAARYLERAEDTARIVLQHTNIMVDMPDSVPLTWDPLLAILGDPKIGQGVAGEREIIDYLACDLSNPSSIVASVVSARENLRATREVLPRAAWQAINDLFLYVGGHSADAVPRASRTRYLSHVVSESQRIVGILAGTMSRDAAYGMMRLGRNIERADMTTRVLDVRAGSLIDGDRGAFDDIQWVGVLQALSALQMYRRATRAPMAGDSVVRFCLQARPFPRSVAHCLREVDHCLEVLPERPAVRSACDNATAELASLVMRDLNGGDLHRLMDGLQHSISAIHVELADGYFRPAERVA
jgi:uncharacterized alpha-E superfamily protein